MSSTTGQFLIQLPGINHIFLQNNSSHLPKPVQFPVLPSSNIPAPVTSISKCKFCSCWPSILSAVGSSRFSVCRSASETDSLSGSFERDPNQEFGPEPNQLRILIIWFKKYMWIFESGAGIMLVSCVSRSQLSNYATFLTDPPLAPLSIVMTLLSTATAVFVTPMLSLLLIGTTKRFSAKISSNGNVTALCSLKPNFKQIHTIPTLHHPEVPQKTRVQPQTLKLAISGFVLNSKLVIGIVGSALALALAGHVFAAQ